MSCDITRGRLLDCKDAVGGLKAVYFINYDAVDAKEITVDAEGRITSFGTPGVPLAKAFEYDLHLGNDLTQNIQSSAENGTLYFEQVLSLTLKKLTQEDNINIQMLAAGHPHIIVEDQMGNFWYAGMVNGLDVTGGTAVTGQNFGDLNGYTLTFTGMERMLANMIGTDSADAMTIITTNFEIVKGIAPTP